MHRYFVTGTDTDVGKTRVTAALALALSQTMPVRIVKAAQTGVDAGQPGDAERAGVLAGVPFEEVLRYEKPADPWSASIAEGAPEPRLADILDALRAIDGAIVVEGAGGLMVPLNANEHFGHLAKRAGLEVIVAVGLRLGCINHAMLTLAICQHLQIPVAGLVLVERWEPVGEAYVQDVLRALQGNAHIFGIVPFAADEQSSVVAAARLFADLVK